MIRIDKVYEESSREIQYSDPVESFSGLIGGVKARYIHQDEITFKGNALIEALPPMKSEKELYNLLSNPPIFYEEERNLNNDQRIIAATRLLHCLIPLTNNVDVYRNLGIVIRRGYATKNIERAEYIAGMRKLANTFKMKGKDNINIGKFAVFNEDFYNNGGLLLVGKSGCGKSSAIGAAIAQYPKSITHISMEPDKALFVQIPIVNIICSVNGSVRGLCDNFFSEVDKIAGTSYNDSYNKGANNTDALITAVKLISMIHGVGAIVVDEIEQLNGVKTGNYVMNFLANLSDQLKVPIIFIGTYEVLKGILGKDFRHARRGDGIKSIEFTGLSESDEYKTFMKKLWNYQWNREVIPLDDDILKAMYEKSQGITDRIIKIFVNAQIEAIESGSEKITPTLIRRIDKETFLLTRDLANAAINFGDTYSGKGQFANRNYANEERIKKELEAAREALDSDGLSEKELVFNEIMRFASEFGSNINKSKKVANKLLEEFPSNTDIKKLKKEFLKRLDPVVNKKSNNSSDSKSKSQSKQESKGIRPTGENRNLKVSNEDNAKFVEENATKGLF